MNPSRPHKEAAVVIIPVYKCIPTKEDIFSIERCFKILKKYSIIALIPDGLTLENYPFKFSGIERFDQNYFSDILGYNRLMLSSSFYKRFVHYHYMLIYQTDAFVFSDQLDYWCKLGYDYIGAPWLYTAYADKVKFLKESFKGFIHRKYNIKDENTGLPTERQFHNVVGNGGFSLRRVEKFLSLCQTRKRQIEKYLAHSEKQYNEDVFWSIEVNRKQRILRIPSYKKALLFAVESYPILAFSLLKGKLPFGCHGWNAPQTYQFWKSIVENAASEQITVK